MDKVYLIVDRYHYIKEDENGQEIGWVSRLRSTDYQVYKNKEKAQAICDSMNEKMKNDADRGPCDPYYKYEVAELEVV